MSQTGANQLLFQEIKICTNLTPFVSISKYQTNNC